MNVIRTIALCSFIFSSANGMQKKEKLWERMCPQSHRISLASGFSEMGYSRRERHKKIKELIRTGSFSFRLDLLEGLICSNMDSEGNYVSGKIYLPLILQKIIEIPDDRFHELFDHAIQSGNIWFVRKCIADGYHDPKEGPFDSYLLAATKISEEMVGDLLATGIDVLRARKMQSYCSKNAKSTDYPPHCKKFNDAYQKALAQQIQDCRRLEQERMALKREEKELELQKLFFAMRRFDAEENEH